MSNDSPSATITLNIAIFNDVKSGGACLLSGVTVAPSNMPSNASVAANPLAPYTLRVAVPDNTAISLTFQALGPQPASGQGTAVYNVEAVYFCGSGQGSIFSGSQQINPGVFPLGTSVTVTDTPTTSRPTGAWEFVVIVGRVVTSGSITWKSVGIIDPPIDNEPC